MTLIPRTNDTALMLSAVFAPDSSPIRSLVAAIEPITQSTTHTTTATPASAIRQSTQNITARTATGTVTEAAMSGTAWDRPSSSCSTSSWKTFLT